MELYFDYIPREINELILFHLDKILDVNNASNISNFQQIYKDPHFVNKMIEHNMPHYENIGLENYLDYGQLFVYYQLLLPSYNKAVARFENHAYEKDGKVVITNDKILSLTETIDISRRLGEYERSTMISHETLKKLFKNKNMLKIYQTQTNILLKKSVNLGISIHININKGIVKIRVRKNIKGESLETWDEIIYPTKKQLITLMTQNYMRILRRHLSEGEDFLNKY